MLGQKVAAAAFAVTVSNFNKDVMVKECGETLRDKIHVIHNGVEPEVLSDATRPVDGHRFRIVCVGSFEEVKGHQYLVEACRQLRDRGVDFECHLVGDGPMRPEIERQIAREELRDRFILHGYCRRQRVFDILRLASVKVAPSAPTRDGKREGMPNVLIEALALGVPVVSTRLTGIPELVQPGRTGMLAEPGPERKRVCRRRALCRESTTRA